MYVTRPLSTLRRSPATLALPPPEGPNSGILVIQDEESQPTCCFGCKSSDIKDLPFPQNKSLEHRYTTGIALVRSYHFQNVFFLPVLNQPLSSNRYYAIYPYGKHRGEAHTSSGDEDVDTCCFSGYAADTEPRPLDPANESQQFEIRLKGGIINNWGGFTAKSIAPDHFPPFILGRKGWKLLASTCPDFEIGEAKGLDTTLRAQLPEFTFPLSNMSSKPVIVGKWYCPFMFIREGTPKTLKDEMNTTMYYEMTLEQRWEQIFASENKYNQGNAVLVDALVRTEVVTVAGREAVLDKRNVADKLVWFMSSGNEGAETRVALSQVIVERMKWEQERVGWFEGEGKQMMIKREEEYGGKGGWKKFGCYVLVERFVLKRLDGSLVLSYDFKHPHQIRCKWE